MRSDFQLTTRRDAFVVGKSVHPDERESDASQSARRRQWQQQQKSTEVSRSNSDDDNTSQVTGTHASRSETHQSRS